MSDMALKAQDMKVHIREGLVSSIRIFYKSSCDHPFVWGFIFSLLILYIYHPFLFACLVSSAPVIVCTAILLGTLLIYGDANIPETEREYNIKGSRNVRAGDNNAFDDDDNLFSEHVASKSAHSGEGKGLRAKPALSTHFHSLNSTWYLANDNDASSCSESDHAESSLSDGSVSDIIPILDELHPLLDPDAPQAALRSVDNSDIASSGSSQDQESDDLSAEEETENQEDEEDEGLEKDDATEVVLKWTADDQKNLMDLGTSELERNQRLENLIAKRRARKFLSFHIERNLIDLDGNDPIPRTEELSCFNLQIPSISAPRQNPFDVPFIEETTGLPPIPGSAPSVLQPRQNPFDVPFDQGEENGFLTQETMNQQEFAPSPQREMFFRRHENFAIGASSSGDTKQDTHDSVLKRFFVAEKMISEGPGFVSFQRKLIAKDDSKVSSSDHESDTTSSDIDQKDHKEFVEVEVHPGSHLLPLASRFAEPVEGDGQPSEEVDSVDVRHEQIGIDEGIHMVLNASSVTEGTHQNAAGAFAAVEMEIRQDEYSSAESDAGKIEVIEEKCDDSSSSSSEAFENHSKKSHESSNSEPGRNNSLEYPDDSVRSVSADADRSMAFERVDNSHVVDSVYDSSPSAVEQSLSISPAPEDALLLGGTEGSSSGNSVASDVRMDSAGEGLARRPHNNNVSPEEKLLESDNGGIWVPPPSLSLVEQYESRSREVTEIREQDVIQIGLSEIGEDFGHPVSPVLPKFVLPSRLSLVSTDSDDDTVGRDAVVNNGGSSKTTPKPLTPREVSSILHPDRSGLDKLLINSVDLPSIPEEHSEYLRMEDEHENTIDQTAASSSLIGMDHVEDTMEGFAENGHLNIDKDVGVKGSSKKKSGESSNGAELVRSGALKMRKIRKITKLW